MPVEIVFTGGGSGGHLSPALALISSILEQSFLGLTSANIAYIGSSDGIESIEIPAFRLKYFPVCTGKLRRYFSLQNFLDLFRLPIGICQAFLVLKRLKPRILFSTGGYVAFPAVVAARLLNIPVIIHEQTMAVGLANRLSGFFAHRVLLTFKDSCKFFKPENCEVTGLPLRQTLFSGDRKSLISRFKFTDRPILFITGGAQGSRIINRVVGEILPELLQDFQVIHQCGRHPKNPYLSELEKIKKGLPEEIQNDYVVAEFFRESLPDILNGADLLLGRSGAGTVYEAMTLKLPAIYIPLPGATMNEQFLNAKFVSDSGGAQILAESALRANSLLDELKKLSDLKKIIEMKKNLESLNCPNGLYPILAILKQELAYSRKEHANSRKK
ncbi:glycosyltransferase [Candidatus Riflebacteria bacterium]